MKIVLLLLFFFQFALSIELSGKLPTETNDFIESFECFNENDKNIIKTYTLLLDYRIENVEDRSLFKKTDKDYWKLYDVIHGIFEQCGLVYNFDNIIEETLIDSTGKRNRLSKLRRIEGSTHYTRDKYDSKDESLVEFIKNNPPKYTLLPPKNRDHIYNLKTLKNYQDNTIPKKIYTEIYSLSRNKKILNTLLKYAYTYELKIRNYDRPKKLVSINRELKLLLECIDYYKAPKITLDPINSKRALALKVQSETSIVLLDTLPLESLSYCENNISKIDIKPFDPIPDQTKQLRKPKSPKAKLSSLKKYLSKYDNDKIKSEKAKKYYNLLLSVLNGNINQGSPSLESLELMRLLDCLGDLNKLHKALKADIEEEKLEEIYINRVRRNQIWWLTTIGMLIKQTGPTKKYVGFFDCNMSGKSIENIIKNISKKNSKENIQFDKIREAKVLIEDIFRYFSKLFYKKSGSELDTAKAIKAGIIPLRYIESNSTINSPFGGKIVIEGMPKGGIKLSFDDIPPGKNCSMFIDDIIDVRFGNTRYKGVDYIVVNGIKLDSNYIIDSYIQKLCRDDSNNSVEYIKERKPSKYKFSLKPVKSILKKYRNLLKVGKKINTYGVSANSKWVVIDTSRGLFCIEGNSTIGICSNKKFKNYNSIAISNDGRVVLALSYKRLYLFRRHKDKLVRIKQISDDFISHQNISSLSFVDDNNTIVAFDKDSKKIIFYSIFDEKTIANIVPSFTKKAFEFNKRNPKVTSIAKSISSELIAVSGYIYLHKPYIEIWKLDKDLNGTIVPRFLKSLPRLPETAISTISFDKNNPNKIYFSTRNKIYSYDIEKEHILQEYSSSLMHNSYKKIEVSSDGQWLMGFGKAIEIWDIEKPEYPYDIFLGDKIKGSFFVPNKSDVVIIDYNTISYEANNSNAEKSYKVLMRQHYLHSVKTSKYPIFEAIKYKQNKELKNLIEKGTKLDVFNNIGLTPTHYAVIHCKIDALKMLLKPDTQKLMYIQSKSIFFGATPFQLSIISKNTKDKCVETLNLFLDQGADVNRKFKNGLSPLELALRSCPTNTKKIEMLLSRGAKSAMVAITPTEELLTKYKCTDKKTLIKSIELIKNFMAK